MQIVKNLHQLAEWFEAKRLSQANPDKFKMVTTTQALWIVALHQANMIFDSCAGKDLAETFLQGYPPINEQYIPDWAEGIFYDVCEEDDEQDNPLHDVWNGAFHLHND